MSPHAIGVDIGGTNTKLALVDEAGVVHARESFPTPRDPSPEKLVDLPAHEIELMKNQVRRSSGPALEHVLDIAFVGSGQHPDRPRPRAGHRGRQGPEARIRR